MFSRSIMVIKIKINRSVSSAYFHVVSKGSQQTHSSYNLMKVMFCKNRVQNFSLSSCFFEDKTCDSQNLETQLLKPFQLVSKKNNQLSKVEQKDIELVENLKNGILYHPYKGVGDRAKNVLLEDIKVNFRNIAKAYTGLTFGNLEHKFFLREADILIIGGGAVGLTIAYFIRNNFPFGPEVVVVDKDESFPHSSTNSGQGIVSLQLFTDENEIDALKYGVEFFSSFSYHTAIDGKTPFKLPYDPLGSLLLVDNSNLEQILNKLDIMKKYGMNNKILDPKTLRNKFPWLNVDDVLYGVLSTNNEGMIDPWAYLMALKYKCVNLGVHFTTAEVIDFGFNKGSERVARAICKLPDGSYNSIDFAHCVIAGGLESLNLVNVLNNSEMFPLKLKLPLEERMRYEYCFYNPNGPGMNTPIVVDSEEIYFRREGLAGHYVVGVPSVINNGDENGPYQVLQNKIKPFLMKRMPHFKEIELVNCWTDVYDFCISNQVGITGCHPCAQNIHFALGFSHLALQYLPALGRTVMEKIVLKESTLNLEAYNVENLWRKQHLEASRRNENLQKSIALPVNNTEQFIN